MWNRTGRDKTNLCKVVLGSDGPLKPFLLSSKRVIVVSTPAPFYSEGRKGSRDCRDRRVSPQRAPVGVLSSFKTKNKGRRWRPSESLFLSPMKGKYGDGNGRPGQIQGEQGSRGQGIVLC